MRSGYTSKFLNKMLVRDQDIIQTILEDEIERKGGGKSGRKRKGQKNKKNAKKQGVQVN